jgi:hypothetical protein
MQSMLSSAMGVSRLLALRRCAIRLPLALPSSSVVASALIPLSPVRTCSSLTSYALFPLSASASRHTTLFPQIASLRSFCNAVEQQEQEQDQEQVERSEIATEQVTESSDVLAGRDEFSPESNHASAEEEALSLVSSTEPEPTEAPAEPLTMQEAIAQCSFAQVDPLEFTQYWRSLKVSQQGTVWFACNITHCYLFLRVPLYTCATSSCVASHSRTTVPASLIGNHYCCML